MCSPAGDELSWLAPNLGVWFGGLQQRDEQYRTWLAIGRPTSYWLAGFFNPQGFLTAVQQEITRGHKNENWTLDTVVMHSEVTDIENVDSVRTGPKVRRKKCYIYCFTNFIAFFFRREFMFMVYLWMVQLGVQKKIP